MIQFDRKDLQNYLSKVNKSDRDELKKIIHDNESLIDAHDFDGLYQNFERYYWLLPSSLTAVLLLSDIDPLSYVNEIPSGCFLSLPITSVVIPEGITGIGDFAFKECKSLSSVSIPEGVTKIGDGAFNSTELTEITIPDSVTKIGSEAFSWTSLTNVIIPDSVTEIGDCAFRYCQNLKNITIPKSVTEIEGYAFEGCRKLKSINYTGTKRDWMRTPMDSADSEWRLGSYIVKIICSDGEIKLSALML